MVTSTRKQAGKAVSPPAKKDKANAASFATQRDITTPPRVPRAAAVARAVVPESPVPQPSIQSDEALARSLGKGYSNANDVFKQDVSKPASSVPKFDFVKFGVKISHVPRRGEDKNSTLRVFIIKNKCILWILFPNDPAVGAWAEKCWMDDVRKVEPWIKDMGIDGYVFTWFKNGIKQVNPRGFGIRVFAMYVEDTDMPDEAYLALGRHIAAVLTAHDKNNTSVSVVPDEFFYMRDATWQDVIGYDAALTHLQYTTSSFARGYYQQYKDDIHVHFRDRTFSVELARILHAPLSCIEPQALATASAAVAASNLTGDGGSQAAFAPGFNLAQDDADDEIVDLQNQGDGDDNLDDEDDEFIDDM